MHDAIDLWEVHAKESGLASVVAFRSDARYPALVAQAEARGFKPAPIWMLFQGNTYLDRLYNWRGGVWIKIADNA